LRGDLDTVDSDIFVRPPEPWKPHAYQRRAVKFLLEHACAGLLLDLGLGKTATVLAAIKILKAKGLVQKTLVLAPLRVATSVWPAEIKRWTDFNGLTYRVLHGHDKEEQLHEEADIYITNYESLDWLAGTTKTKVASGRTKVVPDLKRWRSLGFDLVVFDELSKMKNVSTNRFRAIKHLLPTFKRRWGLTGSPAANGLLDLFGQMYALDTGNALGRWITHYRMQYFTLGYDGFTWAPQPGAEQRIYERIAPLCLRMAAGDYMELPELVENTILIDLPPKVRKIYDKMEDTLLAEIDAQIVVAANAAAASTKCRQICSGGVYIDAEVKELLKPPASVKEVIHLHHEKTDALVDLVEELQGAPLLVAFDFRHDLERIREKLGDVPHLSGGVSPKRADELVQLWNAGKLPVFCVHPQSAAHGLNLQQGGASHLCWYSSSWNLELDMQLLGRLRRQGSTAKRIIVHRLVARNTVDELVIEALKDKEHTQAALFEGLKQLAKRRSR